MAPSPIQRLRTFAQRSRAVHSILYGASACLPLADYVADVGPPWPSNAPLWTTLFQGGVLLFVFLGPDPANWDVLSKSIRRRLLATAFLALAYVGLSSWLVFEKPVPGRAGRDVRGFVLRDEVRTLVNDRLTEDDALRGAEYKPESVYTPVSVHAARLGLLVTWMSAFGLFVSCVASVGKTTKSA